MGYFNNPKIPTDGLLMIIDPRNINCWDGSSVTEPFTGRTGTLFGGVGVNGNRDFDFDGTDDRIAISSGFSGTQLTTYSFILWQRIRSDTQYSSRWFGLDSYGTYTVFNRGNVGFHYNPGNSASSSVTIGSGHNATDSKWFQVGVTVNHDTPLVRIGINGDWKNSWTIHPSSGFQGNINLGAQRATTNQQPSDCEISHFSLYNREITEEELNKNYQVFRARFGL
jgi:hypothetical protein